jgi:short-subunit dehydrogenase
VFPLDLLAPFAARDLHTALSAEGLAIDLLINNAGKGYHGDMLGGTWEKDRDTLDLNIGALVELTRLFGQDMATRGFGRILQVASTGAYQPAPSLACYGASKAFVLSYGEALGREWRGTGVTCTVLSPGFTATEFFQSSGQPLSWLHRLVMMDSKVVARIGVRALLAGKRAVIAGWGNAALAWAERFFPRRMVTAIAHFILDPKNAWRR